MERISQPVDVRNGWVTDSLQSVGDALKNGANTLQSRNQLSLRHGADMAAREGVYISRMARWREGERGGTRWVDTDNGVGATSSEEISIKGSAAATGALLNHKAAAIPDGG